MTVNKKLESLLEWLKVQEITFEAINIKADTGHYSGDAWGIFAARDVTEGTVLATIPKRAVLSVQNSSIKDCLEENRIGGGR